MRYYFRYVTLLYYHIFLILLLIILKTLTINNYLNIVHNIAFGSTYGIKQVHLILNLKPVLLHSNEPLNAIG